MRSRSTKSSLDFIGDAKATRGANVLVRMFQIAVRIDHRTANALNAFGDVSGNATGCSESYQVSNVTGIFPPGVRIIVRIRSAQAVGRYGVLNPRCCGNVVLPGVMTGQCHRQAAAAMITVAKCDHVVIACVSPRHQNRQLIRLRAGIDKVTNAQIARQLRCERFSIVRDVWV